MSSSFATPWTATCWASLSFSVSQSLLKFMCFGLVISSNHHILCHTPYPPVLKFSKHQGLLQWGSASHQVAKVIGASASPSVLPINIQGWFPLGLVGVISLLSKGFSRVFSSTTVWKHQFFSAQPSLWSNSHICTWLLEKP